jgi:hypothetical protein
MTRYAICDHMTGQIFDTVDAPSGIAALQAWAPDVPPERIIPTHLHDRDYGLCQVAVRWPEGVTSASHFSPDAAEAVIEADWRW